jgi:predicted Fe-Mo cluster-binding NifX family protein
MKLAITVWNQRVAPVFDSAGTALILELRGAQVIQRHEMDLDQADPDAKLRLLRQEGVRELICGAITRQVETRAQEQGIRVLPFVAGDLETVIQAWMGRRLDNDAFSMPGCGCGGRRRRHGRGPGGPWRTQGGNHAQR